MLRTVCTAIAATMLIASPAAAESKLLKEIVSFTGAVLHYQLKVPGLVFGVVKDGDIVVVGYGEHRDGSGTAPDGDTLMRIGSINKAFTGAALASLVADGTVTLAERASFVFLCEGLGPVPARFGERDVELTLPDGVVELPQLLSGSGARYGNQTIEFWNKGDEATLTRTIAAGSVEHACRED
jgi:hypothetical protein